MSVTKKQFTCLYVILVIVSAVLATYFFSFSIQHPYIGALVKQEDGEYKIVEVEPDTWSRKNLDVGDILLSVNQLDPSRSEPIQRWGMLEQANEIVVKHIETGEIEIFHVQNQMDTQMVFQIIVPAIVFLLTLYVTFLIYRSKKEATKSSSLLLILFLLDIALAYISGGASARGEFIGRSTVTILFVLVPIFYLHFIYLYFKELNTVWFSKYFIWFGYLLVLINTIFNVLTISGILPGLDVIHAKALNLSSFLLSFLLSLVLILVGLIRVQDKVQKHLIKTLNYSNALAFLPFLFFYVFPYILLQRPILSPVILASFLLIIPFTLVYQFLSEKIYDVEFIVGRLKYYTFMSVIPSILGIYMIILTKSNHPTIFTLRGFLVISLTMLLGFYLKDLMDIKFNFKRIYEKQNYQERIFEFTQKIRSANEFNEVIIELKSTISDTLNVSEAYVLKLNKNNTLDENISDKKHKIFNDYKESIINSTVEVGSIIEISKGFILNIGGTQKKNYILVALEQVNTPKLTRDELSWLKTLTYYSDVTIESFSKIEQFMEHLNHLEEQGNNSTIINRVIYQLEEKQRSALAKDLHDSVLQDLLSIKRKLELDAYTEETSDDVSEDSKNLILEDMNRVITITREACHELRPNVLYDLGLEKALKKLVEQHVYVNDYNIRFTSNKIDENIQSEIQLNLYRISQELLNNTKKHSNAKNIVLMLVKIKDKIVLHYEDDGVGTNPDKLFSNTSSMGLSGIQERVKMLNGTMQVKTGINEGFKVQIEI